MVERIEPVEEAQWSLYVNGQRVAEGSASPGHVRDLCVGHLVACGYLHDRADLLAIRQRDLSSVSTRVDITVPEHLAEDVALADLHRERTGCGLLHDVTCVDPLVLRVPGSTPPDDAVLASALKHLFHACDEARPDGGVHAACIMTNGSPGAACVDVARHAAVDRAIGVAFLEDGLPVRGGLVLTARVSGAIALAAARAGISWIASRSIPTTIAVRIADAAGMAIVARAGGRSAYTFLPAAPVTK